ncbi:TrmB family transcriptional regulator [Halostagnicola bangensis]
METDTLKTALEEAGLTGQQADAYLTLLELGPSPVVRIAEHSSVSSSRIYDVVRALEEQGFVETIERDRLHTRPREPMDVLDRLRNKSEILADAADEIEDRWEQPDPMESRVSVLKRKETILRRTAEAISRAEIAIELAVTPSQLRELRSTIETAIEERDVLVQISVYDAGDADVPVPDDVLEVRRCPIPGPFLAIIDRLYVFFSPNVHADEPYGVTIGDEILSFILHWYFLTCLWAQNESIHVSSNHPPTYVSVEGFVHDVSPLFFDSAEITVQIIGHDTTTGELLEVTGSLAHITSNGQFAPNHRPTYTELAGQVTLFLDTEDGLYTIGGWGALVEDVEAEVLRIEGIEFPPL